MFAWLQILGNAPRFQLGKFMSKSIEQLKAEAYDLIAEKEKAEFFIRQILEQLQAKNLEIQQAIEKEAKENNEQTN